jgi:hypothetical protein
LVCSVPLRAKQAEKDSQKATQLILQFSKGPASFKTKASSQAILLILIAIPAARINILPGLALMQEQFKMEVNENGTTN